MSKGRQVEVTSATARSHLDAALQHIFDKKEGSVEDEPEIDVTSYSQEPVLNKTPTSSPRKALGKSRKRKRKDSSEGESEDSKTVIMKLFDRSVDLALFPEDTPLYPVCRAWIQNKPHDKTLGTISNDDQLDSKDTKPPTDEEMKDLCIYELPPPIKSELGQVFDLRIPAPLPQPDEHLDIHADPRTAPPAEKLLLNHMARWRDVRRRWHEASQMNEMQYASSMQLLKNMYDQSMMMEGT